MVYNFFYYVCILFAGILLNISESMFTTVMGLQFLLFVAVSSPDLDTRVLEALWKEFENVLSVCHHLFLFFLPLFSCLKRID